MSQTATMSQTAEAYKRLAREALYDAGLRKAYGLPYPDSNDVLADLLFEQYDRGSAIVKDALGRHRAAVLSSRAYIISPEEISLRDLIELLGGILENVVEVSTREIELTSALVCRGRGEQPTNGPATNRPTPHPDSHPPTIKAIAAKQAWLVSRVPKVVVTHLDRSTSPRPRKSAKFQSALLHSLNASTLHASVSSAGSTSTKAVKSVDKYGVKCCLCGFTLLNDLQSGCHTSATCKATMLHTTVPVPTRCRYDRGALVEMDSGAKLCTSFNYTRWVGGGCQGGGRHNGAHRCSLCAGEHAVYDCNAFTYLPLLPPRPLAETDKVIFHDQHDQPYPLRKPNIASINQSHPKPVTLRPRPLPKISSYPLLPHSYPSDVPACIKPEDKYRCRWLDVEIVAAFEKERTGLGDRITHILNLPNLGQPVVSIPAQRTRDESLFKLIRDKEKACGKVSDAELDVCRPAFQYSDGDGDNASICIFAHYPPPPTTHFAITPAKDGGALLRAGGLSPFALSGDGRFWFGNILPRYFQPPKLGESSVAIPMVPVNKNKARAYPRDPVSVAMAYHADTIVQRVRKGTSQTVLLFGADGAAVIDRVVDAVNKDPTLGGSVVSLECMVPAPWQLGVPGPDLVHLRHLHAHKSRPVSASLFTGSDSLIAKNSTRIKLLATAKTGNVKQRFTLVYSLTKPGGILLFSVDHMTHSHLAFGGMPSAVAQDLGITLIEDLFFSRFVTKEFPPPLWRFSQRKTKASDPAKDVALERLKKIRILELEVGYRYSESDIPQELRRSYEDALPVPADPGEPKKVYDVQDRVGRREWLVGHRGGVASRKDGGYVGDPRSENRNKALLAKSQQGANVIRQYFRPGGVPYASTCECGITSLATEYCATTDRPMIRAIRAFGAGRHPTRPTSGNTTCLVNIPLDKSIRESAVYLASERDSTGERYREIDHDMAIRLDQAVAAVRGV